MMMQISALHLDDDDDYDGDDPHLQEGHCSGRLETEKTFLPQCSKQRMWGSRDSNPEQHLFREKITWTVRFER